MRNVRTSIALISFILLFAFSPAAHAADSAGTDFWIAFPRNVPPYDASYVLITAATATSGVVTNASLAINVPFIVTPGTPTVLELPTTAQLESAETVESKGIHVTSLAPITVHVSARRMFSGDAALALPVDAIGTDYMLMSWGQGLGVGSELAVVGTVDDTTVTITPTITIGARTAGVPFQVVLDQGQTYFLSPAGPGDLTGSTIAADQPVSVFGGHSCGQVPTTDTDFCDYLVEQMLPINSWGDEFLTIPLATRTAGDVIRVMASQNGTSVNYNGSLVAILNAGMIYQTSAATPAHITASHPVSVAQYAKGSKAEPMILADPFQMTVIPTTLFQPSYAVPTGPADLEVNFLNIIAPAAAVGTVQLDGVAVPPASFTPIESSGYSGAQIAVAVGEHRVTASAPIGVWMYGFDASEGYGYPAGVISAPLGANLSIAKTSNTPVVAPSGPVSYTIVVSNSGPDTAVGATVTDDFDAALTNVTWTCVASVGATCGNGAGDLVDLVTIPAGGNVTYTVSATAPAVPANIGNTATVAPPDNTNDPVPANNSSTANIVVGAAPAAVAVPTASEWALMLLGISLALFGALGVTRR